MCAPLGTASSGVCMAWASGSRLFLGARRPPVSVASTPCRSGGRHEHPLARSAAAGMGDMRVPDPGARAHAPTASRSKPTIGHRRSTPATEAGPPTAACPTRRPGTRSAPGPAPPRAPAAPPRLRAAAAALERTARPNRGAAAHCGSAAWGCTLRMQDARPGAPTYTPMECRRAPPRYLPCGKHCRARWPRPARRHLWARRGGARRACHGHPRAVHGRDAGRQVVVQQQAQPVAQRLGVRGAEEAKRARRRAQRAGQPQPPQRRRPGRHRLGGRHLGGRRCRIRRGRSLGSGLCSGADTA